MLRIRAHHLICMQLFAGKGYDDEFAANMSLIIGELSKNPDALFSLAGSSDDVCLHCPNLSEDKTCMLGNADVLEKDNIIISRLDMNINCKYTYREVLTNIESKMNEDCFLNCCNTCRWFKMNYCSYEDLIRNCKTNNSGIMEEPAFH